MRGQRALVVRAAPVRGVLHALRVAAVAVLVFVIARAAWYPVWAMRADHDALESSWGGPNPFLATVAHWLVAGLFAAVCLGVCFLCTRLLRERY